MSYKIPNAALAELNPQYIRMYLNGTGWKKTYSKKDHYDVFSKDNGNQVIVPRRESFSDYVTRVQELLNTISLLESRSITDIYSDISLVNASDSIQYRISDGNFDGTISASTFYDMIDVHRSVSASAYMDLSEPAAFHRSCRKGYSALKDMRIGQTDFGSYIVRFIYPYGDPRQTDLEGTSSYSDPIVKKVASKISNSSRSVVEAAEDGSSKCDSKISYNFVDALMGLEKISQVRSLEMTRVDFISTGTLDEPISFNSRIFPRIANIVNELKPKELDKERSFEGWISHADKESQETDTHRFKLSYLDGENTVSAYVVLSGRDVQIAHESMTRNKFVSMKGVLKGYSNRKTIESVSEFRIIGE